MSDVTNAVSALIARQHAEIAELIESRAGLRAEVERLKREGDARRDTLELRWQDCERLEIR